MIKNVKNELLQTGITLKVPITLGQHHFYRFIFGRHRYILNDSY
jgi:hypothetical protein